VKCLVDAEIGGNNGKSHKANDMLNMTADDYSGQPTRFDLK